VVYVKSWGPIDGRGPSDPSLRSWIVDEEVLRVSPSARVMHCLPVRRGVEISGEVLDGPRSLVTDQAGNRLWAAAAVLEHLARERGVLD
jgi:N-succinyl-L-ornithine transcarbamylase